MLRSLVHLLLTATVAEAHKILMAASLEKS